jgi:hypothetical protein
VSPVLELQHGVPEQQIVQDRACQVNSSQHGLSMQHAAQASTRAGTHVQRMRLHAAAEASSVPD